MSDINKFEANLPVGSWPKGQAIIRWIARHAAIVIAVCLALAIAAYFLGSNMLDTLVPIQGDVRSHIMKIELLHTHLSQFSWPQWNPYWYQGIPEDQFYPPGFYFLSTVLTFIVKNGVVAYKIWLFAALALNGLAIYFFSRRFLKFDSHLAAWCLIAYESSTPLLINFMYGEGPNLLGWSVSLGFLTVYLSQAMENQTRRLKHVLLPGILLGVAILIHPFPVIFAALAVVLFHITWLMHHHDLKLLVRSQLEYLAKVAIIGAIIGMYYWLPAILTLNSSSPIYSFTKFQWPGGTLYLLALVFLALAVFLSTRYKLRGELRFDFIFACFCLAAALGFGATRYLPFGLDSLVQEFRYSSIIIPFFSILVIVFPLRFRRFHVNIAKLSIALAAGIFVAALVFGLDKREAFLAGFKAVPNITLASFYNLVSQQFKASFPAFAVTMLPYFVVILFLALIVSRKKFSTGTSHPAFILAGGTCLILLTSFIPFINTGRQVGLDNLSKYINYYEQPYYAEIMESIKHGKLIVPMSMGFLTEGDGPVTFGRRYGIETVNGPYNQGDPKFFKFTVHLEWEERWLYYEKTRENLMQESGAKYIFIRGTHSPPNNLNGLKNTISNSYARIFELNQEVALAAGVTPILIDVRKTREVTEFFNILMPDGYKLVLIDKADIIPSLVDKFSYIMVDDESKISAYPGKTVLLLNGSVNPGVKENQSVIRLNVPYLTYTGKIFYHGDIADGYMWIGWDNWAGSRITPEMQANLDNIGKTVAGYFEKLEYNPAGYEYTNNRIGLKTSPGFTLVKNSYFPYWKASDGIIMPTSQGFMLVHSGSEAISLRYQQPLYYLAATALTVLGLVATIILFVLTVFSRRFQKVKAP